MDARFDAVQGLRMIHGGRDADEHRRRADKAVQGRDQPASTSFRRAMRAARRSRRRSRAPVRTVAFDPRPNAVTSTAIAMPSMPNTLPRGADSCADSPPRLKMKSIPAAR
jgi:hypothetical protein